MMLETNRPNEEWREVYRAYRDRIDLGELRPGDPLPTLAGLAHQNDLSTHGARKVMARLRSEGRVESWQGVGHRVSERRIVYRIDSRPKFNANIARHGHRADTRLLATRAIGLPTRFASAMGLRPGTRIVQTELLRFAEGRPLVLTLNFFPADRFLGIEAPLAETQSVTQALSTFGVSHCQRHRTSVETRMPSAHEALQLEIPANQPVLVTTGRNVDQNGTVIELSYAVSRGDAVTIEI
ncbi:MAG: GntR family transcriptional regulator [Pseudomonadota bacterium]